MAAPDTDARSALGDTIIRPVFVAWLDIAGDPVRVTTNAYSVAFTGTGDPDLDGHTFNAIDPQFVSVGPVQAKEGGTETVTVTMSGLIGVDTDLMNLIGDRANWQGRFARLWLMMMTEDFQRIGGVWNYYTGYMSVPKIAGDASQQTIQLDIESYLAFLSQPSNRSYLNQADYDAGDLSARASIAIANGTTGSGGSTGIGGASATGFAGSISRAVMR